jgi:hypothetical protein
MANKTANFITETVTVKWSHLHKPDDKFGADTANHNITVQVDEDLKKAMDKVVKEMGATKVNGVREDEDGTTLLKAKTKWFVKKQVNKFPCVDANAKETEALPFQGDKVRLRLAPIVIDRDNSISFFLNGVQIIEKTEREYTGGFDKTDGFDGSDYTMPTNEDSVEVPDQQVSEGDDLPF